MKLGLTEDRIAITTSAEGNAFPREGHGNKFFRFDTFVQVNFRASHRQYQEIWRWARNSGPFSILFGRHGNKKFCRPAGTEMVKMEMENDVEPLKTTSE